MRCLHVSGNDRDHVYCSEDACPCGLAGAVLPRGKGYVNLSEQVVEFRRDCLIEEEPRLKMQRLQDEMGASIFALPGVFAPILMCEQGARKRGIDLEVAAEDAAHWWQTGLVTLRITPLPARHPRTPKRTGAQAGSGGNSGGDRPRSAQAGLGFATWSRWRE
ncbi:MAG: hypothetical protein QHJ34_08680 [bacterium]|jgi:hypothetical protein|nr:hypothetical protein [candidate division KSB1 bacterium]MDH7560288.1 hypothetical protein [bacterium]